MRVSEHRLGLVLTTASAVAWSTAGFFTRLIPLDSWTMLIWRGAFGALGIAMVMAVLDRGRVWSQFRAMGWPGWLFAGISGLGMIFFITGLRHTTVTHVAVIYATVPLVAAALGWVILHERPRREAVLASLAALVGVAVMVRFGSGGAVFGDVLAFGMTLSMAVMMIIARRFRHIPVIPAACLSALLSGLVCVPVGHPLGVSLYDLGLLALFGLVNSAAGLALFTLGARLLPPIETALIGSLDAPLAPLWVWLAFAETPGRNTVIGALIVFTAVSFHILASEQAQSRSVGDKGDGAVKMPE